jgi:hypothetical protein
MYANRNGATHTSTQKTLSLKGAYYPDEICTFCTLYFRSTKYKKYNGSHPGAPK